MMLKMKKEQTTISQLYCEKLEKELTEKKENLNNIYYMISDLRDYIDNLENYDIPEYIKYDILEKLQDMQQYAK